MKKYLILFVFLIMLLFIAGCNNRGNIVDVGNTKSPVDKNEADSESDISAKLPDNTSLESSLLADSPSIMKNVSIKDFADSLMKEDYLILEGIDITNMSDEELSQKVINEARSKKYNVYDLEDVKRSTVNSEELTVDVDLTVKRLKSDNMASTRYVFKGSRTDDMSGFEKVAEYKTPLRSKSQQAIGNIELANEKLNGIVLRSGEEFSFSFFLGEQNEEKGYKEATVYIKDKSSGQVEEKKEVGGGICQVSSTLHAACLKLNLKIKERHEHSKEVSYIKEGLDAAIAGSYYDLKFENITNSCLVFEFCTEEKSEVVRIYKVNAQNSSSYISD